MTDYLKEDRKRILQRAKELKESAFSREFAQQMRQKGEGGVYRSKVTGQNILLKYANKPAAKPSAPAPVAAKPSVKPVPAKPAAQSQRVSSPLPGARTGDRTVYGGSKIDNQQRAPVTTKAPVGPPASVSKSVAAPVTKATKGIPSAAQQMKDIEATPKPDSYVPKVARIGRETTTAPKAPESSSASVSPTMNHPAPRRENPTAAVQRQYDSPKTTLSKDQERLERTNQTSKSEPETKAPAPTAPMMTQTSGSVTTNNASDEPPDDNMRNPSVQDIINKLKPKQQNESVVNVGGNRYRIV